ncbi:MAG TPA: XdhC/CoxI family protein [Candidatus Ozemobacteraceae bacterium]|nr:XdhC/CoxI family protein [Candidatus Ozemobacteraceae bacterium]
MATELFQELREAFNGGKPFVLCTVVEVDGSSPGKAGQRMIVFEDGRTQGTVGGGINEERTRKAALALFPERGGAELLSYDLANEIDTGEPVCGGNVKVFIEYMADRNRILIFGGGHIGCALARLAGQMRFHVTLLDDRSEYADPEKFPGIESVLCRPYAGCLAELEIEASDAIVIVTPGHLHDREVLEQAIASPAEYVGMIGSARKVVEMKKSLQMAGTDPKRLERVFAPIGIHLGSNTPEEIALEILAQIVAFRNGITLRYSRAPGK